MSGLILDSTLRAAVHVGSSKIPSNIAKSSAALFSAFGGSKPTLPDLPYDYGALEPVISAETMTIHHTKHHNAYITNLTASMSKLDSAVNAGDITAIVALQNAIKFNGGGHLNHTLFWENLTPEPNDPGTVLDAAIRESFGDFANMKEKLTAKSVAVQGSGWGWLAYDKVTGGLDVVTCANQDPLLATTGLIPLIGIDVWEHAYYVDYRNVRPDYVNNIWNVINWKVVEGRLNAAQ